MLTWGFNYRKTESFWLFLDCEAVVIAVIIIIAALIIIFKTWRNQRKEWLGLSNNLVKSVDIIADQTFFVGYLIFKYGKVRFKIAFQYEVHQEWFKKQVWKIWMKKRSE